MLTICILGSGSGFSLGLLNNLFSLPPIGPVIIRLFDLKTDQSERIAASCRNLVAHHGRPEISAVVCASREEAMAGADHVMVSFCPGFPGGLLRTCSVLRFHKIPISEGETAGPGALMGVARTLPALLGVAADLKRLCPLAWLHVTPNPMSRFVHGLMKYAGIERVVGHCHGSDHLRLYLGGLTNTPREHIDYHAIGINHCHLVTRLKDARDGRDLMDDLPAIAAREAAVFPVGPWCKTVMWQNYLETGLLIGPGDFHTFDFLPWAQRRFFRYPIGGTTAEIMTPRLDDDGKPLPWLPPKAFDPQTPAGAARFVSEFHMEDHVVGIAAGLSGLGDYRMITCNDANRGLVPGLPDDAVLESTGWARHGRLELEAPTQPLPELFLGVLHTHLTAHRLSVQAVVEGSRALAIQAILAEPAFRDGDCTAAVLLDEMLAVNQGLVTPFV